MLLHRLAETSKAVATTSSRKAKGELLAEVLVDLNPTEVEPAVGFLTGSPRQGAIGVGWATVSKVRVEPALTATIELLELDQLLSAIAATTGPGSTETRASLLTMFLARATESEHDFVRRLIIGDLRQGASAGVLTDAVAKAAGVKTALLRRAVMLQGDLGQAAVVALTDGGTGLGAIDLVVGRPIQPMLASTSTGVAEAIGDLGRSQVEWKLDGARIQVHIDGDVVAIYTRNLNDVTDRLPQVVEQARSFDCHDAVLDGEVLSMADNTNLPKPFQDTMSAFATEADDDDDSQRTRRLLQASYFDLMYLDGVSLIDRPLLERSTALRHLTGNLAIPAILTEDPGDAEAHLAAALAAGHEGVMVKSVDGIYEAGRRGKTWRKVKPVHTLDLVVLAAEWGHGRRHRWLSNLHLGARDPEGGEFIMVGKTFKGLTDKLLSWQTAQFLTRKTGETSDGHTVHVRPELVVEIALDGAQTSTRYPGGVALRFARVKGYRHDRSADTADTIDAVRALL